VEINKVVDGRMVEQTCSQLQSR